MNVYQRRDETELITSYFQQGFTNIEILEFLKLHGIKFSSSTLKRRLQSLGLQRDVYQLMNKFHKMILNILLNTNYLGVNATLDIGKYGNT
jgi:arginine repressor